MTDILRKKQTSPNYEYLKVNQDISRKLKNKIKMLHFFYYLCLFCRQNELSTDLEPTNQVTMDFKEL